MTTTQLSPKRGRQFSKGCRTLFFALFLLSGLTTGGFLSWALLKDALVYLTFAEGTCRITGQELLENYGDDSITYAPHFDYQVTTQDGQTVRAGGYKRSLVYFSGRAGQEKILDQFKVERSYPCWYNPADPTEAVLVRGLSLGWIYLMAVIPVIFIAIGVWGIKDGLGRWGQSAEAMTERVAPNQALSEWLPAVQTTPGQYLDIRLSTAASHGKKLLGLIAMAIFWNGIVGIFVAVGLAEGEFSIWVWAFLSIFILAGLGLIVAALRQALTWAFGGQTIVEISDEPLHFGQTADLYIKQSDSKPVQAVTVKLICQEWVRYRQGTDTYTDERTVYEQTIFAISDLSTGLGAWQQNMTMTVPDQAMHSFKADDNAINWRITVSIKLAGAPDFELAFPVCILPSGYRE